MKKNIEFIYFDVGGVVILDFSKTNKWNEMLSDLNIPQDKLDDFNELFDEYKPKIAIGLAINEFIEAAKAKLGIKFPDNYDMNLDFVNRFEPNPELAPIIKTLKQKYRIGLLTDMYPGMLDRIREKGLLPEVEWDIIVDSSIEGCKKPHREIFELAEDRPGVASHDILFVDNKEKNIAAAKESGWNTVLYDPSDITESNKELKKRLLSSEVL